MRKAVIPFIVSMGLIAVWAAPAEAASTRADYIAQADPICISTAGAESNALSGAVSNLRKGQFKAAARKLRRAGAVFNGGINQLASLEQPPTDAPLLGNWISSLRAEVPISNRMARAISHRSQKALRRSLNQLIVAEDKTAALVDDYGFGACDKFAL